MESSLSLVRIVVLTGTDESSSKMIHARTSYKADEIQWGVQFADMYQRNSAGHLVSIDIRRIHDVKSVSRQTPEGGRGTRASSS